jgi:hypothetical protein
MPLGLPRMYCATVLHCLLRVAHARHASATSQARLHHALTVQVQPCPVILLNGHHLREVPNLMPGNTVAAALSAA